MKLVATPAKPSRRLACRSVLLGGCALAVLAIPLASHDVVVAQADAKHFNEQVRPFLVKHCQGCHGGEKPKGDFRIDRLSADFSNQANREQWQTVLEKLTAGAMPPKEKPRPPEKETRALSNWITGRVEAADRARRADGRVVLRRLNRSEYENTVRDL